jgi:hypothetical protein
MKIPVGWHPRCGGFVALYHGWLPDLPSVRGIGLMASPFTAMQPRAAGRFSLCSFFDYSVGTCCAGLNMPPLIQRIICCFKPIRGLLIIVRGAFPEGASIRPLIPQYWPERRSPEAE